jgi:pimeloyl-ACP methyl ester carboxylesterase
VPGLNYERRGNGEPLVLMHHLGGEWQVFAPVIGLLAERHDVIAVDLPGFGRSPELPASVEPTPWALAAAVADLLDSLGIERAHASGISLGGWAALELAKRDRALSVTTLCAAGFWRRPLGPRRGISARTVARALAPLVPALFAVPAVRRRALRTAVTDAALITRAQAVEVLTAYARARDYDRASLHMRGNVFSGGEDIAVPVTLAWGENDRQVTPPSPPPHGWRQVVLRGCNHLPTLDDPEQVANVVLEGAALAGDPARSR